MNVTEVEKFACPVCDGKHTYAHDAVNCCGGVHAETFFVCGNCTEHYRNAKMAEECCKDGKNGFWQLIL